MGYLIAGVVVLLLVAGFVTFLVLNATKRGGPAGPADPGAEGHPAGIVAPDSSPLGDTEEHAGEQREGRLAGGTEHADPTREGDGPEAQQPESERLANRRR